MSQHPQKILIIFGTRPEAIKLAPVIRELQADAARFAFAVRICVTAQHRSMLDQVLRTFGIAPHYDLKVMEEGQDLFQVIHRCLDRLRVVLEEERPDWVLVQGDTTSAFAASLAASYLQMPVAHVEAGLRTGNLAHPFPEEINRKLISQLSQLHFAPTLRAKENLLREGICANRIHVTGNTGIDALFYACERLALPRSVGAGGTGNGKRPLILVTSHRRESFGERFRQICLGVREIALRAEVDLVYPVHLNPNVREPVQRWFGDLPNVTLMDPVDYVSFVALMQRAYLILTDSGGVQEEAPSLGKPVLVLREFTERLEGVESGNAKLVGMNPETILADTMRLLEDRAEYTRRSRAQNLYGDGQASLRIAQILAAHPGLT
ncbi:MAG: UDP-N-acetylglucosamine 2-epimerase (non-hydrolyzing) [Acidobacteria bacterium]|nr:UDP-N-acetylglucosamine 2-epimerase (non-hydrolyzing) [Acidobacteriota bacterium]